MNRYIFSCTTHAFYNIFSCKKVQQVCVVVKPDVWEWQQGEPSSLSMTGLFPWQKPGDVNSVLKNHEGKRNRNWCLWCKSLQFLFKKPLKWIVNHTCKYINIPFLAQSETVHLKSAASWFLSLKNNNNNNKQANFPHFQSLCLAKIIISVQ